MVYSRQNAAFSTDKNQFFIQLPTQKNLKHKISQVEKRAAKLNYTFLLENQKALEDEFTQMFAVLQKQKDKNKEAFWLYCYYCATLLESFHRAYSQSKKEAEYKKFKQQIKDRLTNDKEDPVSEKKFIESLKNNYVEGFRSLMNSPCHVSQIRDYVAYSNLCRVYWVFCRLSLTTGFILAKDLQFIDKLDAMLGTHTDVDKIISTIQAPNQIFNYFSVGLFLMRFIIDGGLLIRHTFFPTTEEKIDKTTAFARFKFEIYKRHCNFANDLGWATVNFLANFSEITHISAPVGAALTAAFLGFDVCMALYKCHLAKQEYLVKKAQYQQEMNDYNNPEKFKSLTDKQRLAHTEMLNKQLIELEIDWRTKQETFHFVAAAAALLMLGFTSSLLLSPPGMVVASFFVCTLAVAMYLSAGAYSKYQEKSLRTEQAQLIGQDLQVVLQEYQAARDEFIFTMIKNTVMPALLITTLAICWPAAVALTVMYLGSEMYHAYNQHTALKVLPEENQEAEPSCCFS